MHIILLLFLLDSQPLKTFPDVPPMSLVCTSGTAAVQNDKDNVEHVRCYASLKCSDGTAYGVGACVCKTGMPVLDQDEVVTGCTAEKAESKKTGPR